MPTIGFRIIEAIDHGRSARRFPADADHDKSAARPQQLAHLLKGGSNGR